LGGGSRGTVQGAVRPVLVVVGLVLVQDPPRMGLVPGEGAVQERAAASADQAFGDRVHAGRLDVAEHGPDAGIGEDRVGCGGEVRAAVADHELGPVREFAEVHEEVACLLGGPRAGWVKSDCEDADAPAGVLDHGQDICLGAAGQAGREEAAPGSPRPGSAELRPRWPGPPRRGLDSGLLQDLPRCRCRYLHSQGAGPVRQFSFGRRG
jgi:hypothetical protein